MGQRRVSAVQAGFAGGLNIVSDPNFLRPDQARKMDNFRLTQYGGATKRGGTKQMSASRANGTAIVYTMQWWPAGGVFVSNVGTNLYTSGYAIPVTWTSVASAAGLLNSFPMMRPFYGPSAAEFMYIADGSTHLRKLAADLTTFTSAITDTPSVNGIEAYNQRLWGWFWGNAAGSNALYYSQLAFADSSIGGDSLGVDASGGGTIRVTTFGSVGIVTCRVIGASLLIFHIKGISRLTGFGQDDISVSPQPVSTDFSLVNQTAIDVYNGIGYAVGPQGLYVVTEGGVSPVGTPDRPDPLPAALAATSNVGLTRVLYDPTHNEVWVAVYGYGVYVYHTILGAWAGPFGSSFADAYGMFRFPGIQYSNKAPFMIISDSNGWAYQCDIGTKDSIASDGTGGNTITGTLQLHRLYGADRMHANAWRFLNLMATLTAADARPTVTLSSQLGTGNLVTLDTLTTGSRPYYIAGGPYGPYLDATVTDLTTAGGATYDMATAEGFVLGQR